LISLKSKELEKISTLILYKNKYISYSKKKNDLLFFELLKNNSKSFSNQIVSFHTSQKNINYIQELKNSNLLTSSSDKTIKIFSIDFNKKDIDTLIGIIQIPKTLIKVVETPNLLISLLNNNKLQEPIAFIYNNNNKNKNYQPIKKLFEKTNASDILYIKNDKFGLEENIEEFVVSFPKEETLSFYDIGKDYKNKIIKNIKCSKKKDLMEVYKNLLIIGGQKIFYFIDLYTKNIILKNNVTTVVYSLIIINDLIFTAAQNGNFHIYQITNENKLEKITQKNLKTNNNIIKYLIYNETNKLIYVYYLPILEILKINV